MIPLDQIKALQVCEDILLDKKTSNKQAHILPSENIIIDRLLERKVELQHVYIELFSRLGKYPQALRSFLEIIVSITSMHNPEELVKSRLAYKKLNEVNQQIAVKAHELANFLESRSELINTSEFMTPTHYHIGNVIHEASQNNPYFRSHLQAELKLLQGRFDFKYWPQLHELIRVIAEDARVALPIAIDSVTEAATRGERASLIDYFRALFEAIECNRQKEYGFLPNDFKLTDSSVATLANCALALEPEEMIDGPYVKNFRSRERKRLNSGI
ncbi:TPA: hypothetical protein OXL58_000064 [Acinetobacter baumannii]|nr:hypothetical protein [Acinetobacter baumannii]